MKSLTVKIVTSMLPRCKLSGGNSKTLANPRVHHSLGSQRLTSVQMREAGGRRSKRQHFLYAESTMSGNRSGETPNLRLKNGAVSDHEQFAGGNEPTQQGARTRARTRRMASRGDTCLNERHRACSRCLWKEIPWKPETDINLYS